MTKILSNEGIEKCAQIFEQHPKYSIADRILNREINNYPRNTDLEDVLAKVSLVQTLYATPIYSIFEISRHICKINNLDQLFNDGNISAVDLIRKGHGIVSKKKQKEYDFYSFATKYSSFHNPKAYPIYDTLVASFLLRLHDESKMKGKQTQSSLRSYSVYKAAMETIVHQFGIQIDNYKRVDMGLWIIAKFYYFRSQKSTEDDKWIRKKIFEEFGDEVLNTLNTKET